MIAFLDDTWKKGKKIRIELEQYMLNVESCDLFETAEHNSLKLKKKKEKKKKKTEK